MVSGTPPPVMIDAAPPAAVAAYGGTLAWIRRTSGGGASLVVRSGPAAPRVVVASLPRRADQLTLGTDAQGQVTAVLTAAPQHRTLLYAVALDGDDAAHRLPVDRGRSWYYAPGLRDGRLSFIRRDQAGADTDGYGRTRVMLGSLTSAHARTIRTFRHFLRTDEQTAVAAGARVLLVHGNATDESCPPFPCSSSSAQIGRLITFTGGGHVRILLTDRVTVHSHLDNIGASGFGPLVLSGSGRRVAVSRWAARSDPDTNATMHGPRDLVTLDLTTGRATRQASPGDFDIALPLLGQGFAVYEGRRCELCTGPAPAPDNTGALRLLAGG
jgi:hypothetical protein